MLGNVLSTWENLVNKSMNSELIRLTSWQGRETINKKTIRPQIMLKVKSLWEKREQDKGILVMLQWGWLKLWIKLPGFTWAKTWSREEESVTWVLAEGAFQKKEGLWKSLRQKSTWQVQETGQILQREWSKPAGGWWEMRVQINTNPKPSVKPLAFSEGLKCIVLNVYVLNT